MKQTSVTRLAMVIGLLAAVTSARAGEPDLSPGEIYRSAVAVWQMGDLKDSVGGNDLKPVGAVTLGTRLRGEELAASLACGDDGMVASLDGGYLDAGQGVGGALNPTGSALTVSMRLRSPGGTWELPLFSKHGGHDRLVYNLYSLNSEIGFELGIQGRSDVIRTSVSTGRIGARDWHTIICRYDGSRLQMFVDGVLMDEASASGLLRQGNTEPCLIGAETGGGHVKTGWKGQIDHVAIWKRALSDAEVQRLNGGAERIAAARKRFTEIAILPARADLYRERYRPQYHFTARQWTEHRLNPGRRQEGWVNDPNGLLYYKGTYHLFAQRWNKCWIHATSTDLVHWTEQQPAFWEDHRFGGGTQSGGAVVDWNNTSGLSHDPKTPPLVAFWSGGDNRSQCISYSLDEGRSWTKYEHNPVVTHPERDPKVFWYEPRKQWYMVLYGAGSYFMFTSKNLLDWTELKNSIPDCFECPDMFQLPVDGDMRHQKWVLIRGNGRYSIGEFDGTRFTQEVSQIPCDLGPNFYATQSWGDIAPQPGRRVQIAWMSGGRYPDMPFNQQMTFPCDLTLRTFPEGLRICRLPIPEIRSLYGTRRSWANTTIQPGENLLADAKGDLFDIQLQADLADAGELGIGFNGASTSYSAAKQTLTLLGKQARVTDGGRLITLRILIDRTSMEVFANGGGVSMSGCFLPASDGKGLQLYCTGAPAKIISLDVHELKSAWVLPTPESSK